MSVYEWMFETPYFGGMVAVGVALFAVVAVMEEVDRRRAAARRRCRGHHPAHRVGVRKRRP
jgi:hypothetical protein